MYNVKRLRAWNDDIVLYYVNVTPLVFTPTSWLIVLAILAMLTMMVYNHQKF